MDELTFLLQQSSPREKNTKFFSFSKPQLKDSEIQLFASSLSRLLEGGIPLLRALEQMESAAPSPFFKRFLKETAAAVKEGKSFSQSLEIIPESLPSYFSKLIYAGEISGTLPKVLDELSHYLEKEQALKRKIQEAFAYPSFILLMGLVTIGILMKFVIPKLSAIYENFGSELPLITRIILSISHGFLPAMLMTAGSFLIIWQFFKRSGLHFEKYFSRLPLFGKILEGGIRTQFCRLMGLLLESGVTILEALSITSQTFSLPTVTNDIQTLREDLAEGKGFSGGLDHLPWIDGLSRMLLISGEESGKLPQSFSQIARDTEISLEARLQFLMKILEPVLIVFIGSIVAFIVVGTMLPVLDMSGIIK